MNKVFVFNPNLCIGCKNCEAACKEKYNLPFPLRRVRKMLNEDGVLQYLSMGCNHCANPECLRVCPNRAYVKGKFGEVIHHASRCKVCNFCVKACPFQGPQYDLDLGRVIKCDFCSDLLAKGNLPVCVVNCPTQALRVVEADEKYVHEVETIKNVITKPNYFTIATTKGIRIYANSIQRRGDMVMNEPSDLKELEHKFFLLAATGKSLSAIVDFLYEITQHDVLVCDYNYRILAKKGEQIVDSFTNEFLPPDFLNKCSSTNGFYQGSLHCNKIEKKFILQVIDGNPIHGYVLLFTDQINDFITHSISIACLALRIELSRIRLERQTAETYRSEFLEDILYNNISNQEIMIQRGYTWGWDFRQPYMLMVVSAVLFNVAQTDVFIDRRWHSLMQYWIGKKWPRIIYQERKNQIILFVPQEKCKTDRGLFVSIFKFLQKKTKELLDIQLIGGVGCCYSTNDQLHRAYQEAKMTIETGLLLRKHGELLFYDDFGVMNLLLQQGDKELNDYFTNTLGLLVTGDQEHQSDLLFTLYTYFNYSGDINKAAKALFIHVNTLRYRLKKVEEILGKNLTEYDVIVNLYIALQIGIMLKRIQRNDQDH